MPQPDDITEAELVQWEAEWLEGLANDPPDEWDRLTGGRDKEAWLCGSWLNARLAAAGCPRDIAEQICFANGQIRSAAGGDPWEPTVRALADWRERGFWERPGPELAARLVQQYGIPPRIVSAVRAFGPQRAKELLRSLPRIEVPGRAGRRRH
jgi:hypothetical protein